MDDLQDFVKVPLIPAFLDVAREKAEDSTYISPKKKSHPWANLATTLTTYPFPLSTRRFGSLFKGWRLGVSLGAIVAIAAFLTNLAFIFASLGYYKFEDGITTVYQGSCPKVRSLSQIFHLGINVFSTLLLGSSNYCMQCLSSPTREEVDVAHAGNRSLVIGVPSLKNLGRISRRRVLLWFCLGLSSFPLHLLYNAVVFETISANDYLAILTTEKFVQGGKWSTNDDFAPEIQALQNSTSALEYLDPATCIQSYGSRFISNRRHVLIVSNASDDQNGLIRYDVERPDGPSCEIFSWLCTSRGNDSCGSFDAFSWTTSYHPCDPGGSVNQANNWRLYGADAAYGPFSDGGRVGGQIQYCLSQQSPGQCKLGLSISILAAVTFCNLVKILCLATTLFSIKDSSNLLVTTGDAIASFLDVPDTTTADRSIISRQNSSSREKGWVANSDLVLRRWKALPKSWFQADSGSRWISCMTPIVIMIGGTGFFLLDSSFGAKTLFGNGLGNNDPSLVFQSQFHRSLLSVVLLVNLPQLLVSYVYVVYNGLFTCMLLTLEWSRYAHCRKGLRVTSPRGQQRSTHYLHLPYMYSIPLLVVSGLLHWLVSQSVFMVRVNVFDVAGVQDRIISACGYSPLAMIFTMVFGALMIVTALGIGIHRKYEPGMPSAAICSAAISVACHPTEDDLDAATLPVMFGAIETESGVKLATFSGKEVMPKMLADKAFEKS